MNLFQKIAVFLFRLHGLWTIWYGASGSVFYIIYRIIGQPQAPYSTSDWVGSVLWTMIGILSIAFSKPLGQWFGRGLD